MKNTQKLLLGLGLLLLSVNAAAIMISGTVGTEFKTIDLSMDKIASLLSTYQADTKQESKLLKKANKKYRKIDSLVSKLAGMTAAKAAKKNKKLLKKQQKLAAVMNKMNLDLTAYMVAAVNPPNPPTTPDNNIPPTQPTGGQGTDTQSDPVYTGDAKSVPEPSSIALLGIGLVGFAAARRLRSHS